MAKILVVDDEIAVLDLIGMVLKREGHEIITAGDGNTALEKIASHRLDLILLDLMLPDIDGHELCKKIREKNDTPIIMITAKDNTVDVVLGLELGADDYITKPFENRELTARIKALLRRTNKEKKKENNRHSVKLLELEIQFDNKRVLKNNKNVNLTPREFELLEVLAGKPGKVFSRQELMEKAWGYDYVGDSRAVDIYITRLRKKIEDDTKKFKYVTTVYGFGYKFGRD